MFRIRRIHDDVLPIDKNQIQQSIAILRAQFPLVGDQEIKEILELLRKPDKHHFLAMLFVADDIRTKLVHGFALIFRDVELNYFFLDYISAMKGMTGRGTGGALYERVREEASQAGAAGIFFECLPDEPALSRDPAILKENIARLKFYEAFGARPIAGTAYETPVVPGGDNPPYLVFDDLGKSMKLSRELAKKIVRSILEKKYPKYCPPDYVNMVAESFSDDPIRIREPRYPGKNSPIRVPAKISEDKKIRLVVNHEHAIHHVRERGYVEAPVRIPAILREIEPTGLFAAVERRRFSEKYIEEVHDPKLVNYIKRMSAAHAADDSVYPYVFPIRNAARLPEDLDLRAGYFTIDTFTPLNGSVFPAAKAAVDCGLTAAESIVRGYRLAYALVRPPGHHAEKRVFGGFCYFNTAAVAANYLSRWGKVAILDIDYHHGNGTQDIFYERQDVFTVSIHGHPQFAYPYFNGFAEEKGSGEGTGYNLNHPLPENISPLDYKFVLGKALRSIIRFRPVFLVIALGLDTAKGDPTGSWTLKAKDFNSIGRMIGSLRLPILVVQEGGYNTRNLGINARHFFEGLYQAHNQTQP